MRAPIVAGDNFIRLHDLAVAASVFLRGSLGGVHFAMLTVGGRVNRSHVLLTGRVLGIGAQGSSVTLALVESGGYRVRGITRHADSERAAKLREGGVEVVQADMANREEVKHALEGAYAAYVVTDFYSVREEEFEVGKRAVECAKEAGVKHLVWSTLPDTAKFSCGRISVPHFVLKAKVDSVVESLGFPHHTFLMCAFYFQNFQTERFGFTVLEPEGAAEGGGAAGTVVFKLPLDAHDMLTGFDVDDTGSAVLRILEQPDKWDGKHVCLAGYHAPAAEYARAFGAVTGRPSAYRRVEAGNEEFKEMFKWFSEHTVFGPYDITNGRACFPGLKSWEEWLRVTNWVGPAGGGTGQEAAAGGSGSTAESAAKQVEEQLVEG